MVISIFTGKSGRGGVVINANANGSGLVAVWWRSSGSELSKRIAIYGYPKFAWAGRAFRTRLVKSEGAASKVPLWSVLLGVPVTAVALAHRRARPGPCTRPPALVGHTAHRPPLASVSR